MDIICRWVFFRFAVLTKLNIYFECSAQLSLMYVILQQQFSAGVGWKYHFQPYSYYYLKFSHFPLCSWGRSRRGSFPLAQWDIRQSFLHPFYKTFYFLIILKQGNDGEVIPRIGQLLYKEKVQVHISAGVYILQTAS